jgi:regulator of sigma E protease
MSILLLIIGLLLFVGLVVVHEFGHYLLARRNGVEVEEFGIGFPPRAKVLGRRNGTLYTLNWLPLGGFVKLKGEHDSDTAKGSFGAASQWGKTKIMLAGVVMNLLTAFVLLLILAVAGMPKLVENQFTVAKDTKIVKNEVLVAYIEPGSPAQKAGLQLRDQITHVGKPTNDICTGIGDCRDLGVVSNINDLHDIGNKYAGQKVPVTILRGGKEVDIAMTLRSKAEVDASQGTNNPKGYIGISPAEYTLQRSTWSAPIVAAGLMKQFTVLTFKGLGSAIGNLFRGHGAAASAQVSGPVGIFVLLKDGSELGYQFILMIIAIISLTLAIMNLLPIPALDGGRLFVSLLFRAIRKPLTKSKEEWIHGTGFALLMVLFVLITIVDIKRNF